MLRQRCFFVRQRPVLLNRIHRLLGVQQCPIVDQTQDVATRKLGTREGGLSGLAAS